MQAQQRSVFPAPLPARPSLSPNPVRASAKIVVTTRNKRTFEDKKFKRPALYLVLCCSMSLTSDLIYLVARQPPPWFIRRRLCATFSAGWYSASLFCAWKYRHQVRDSRTGGNLLPRAVPDRDSPTTQPQAAHVSSPRLSFQHTAQAVCTRFQQAT